MDDKRSYLKLVFVVEISGRRAKCFELKIYDADASILFDT